MRCARPLDFEDERDGIRFEHTLYPVLGEGGRVEQVAVFSRDVTQRQKERQQAEEALRRSEEQAMAQVELEAILACIGDGVLVYDREGRTVRSTPAADRILGVPPEERRAPVQSRVMRQYEIINEDGHRVLPDEMVAIRAAIRGETVKGEVQLVRSGAHEPRWIRMNAAPLIVDGEHKGGVLSMNHITERKHAEPTLREANEKLREADRRKDEFLGMLSHELRNPLAPIRNSAYILRRAEPGSEQARRAQTVIERQTEHLTRLVGGLSSRRARPRLRKAIARGQSPPRRTHSPASVAEPDEHLRLVLLRSGKRTREQPLRAIAPTCGPCDRMCSSNAIPS